MDALSLWLGFTLVLWLSRRTAIHAQSDLLMYSLCGDSNYTRNSSYGNNLNSLFHDVTTANTAQIGYYNSSSSSGRESNDVDRAYAVAMCRGDLVGLPKCRQCLNNSITAVPQACPYRQGAIGWFDNCILYYDNDSMIGMMNDGIAYKLCNPTSVSENLENFSQALKTLMEGLRRKAAHGNSTLKYAAGKTHVNGSSDDELYGALQCFPDLNETSCSNCLETVINSIQTNNCVSRRGARIFAFSCILRYEMYDFVNNGTDDQVSPTPSPSQTASSSGRKQSPPPRLIAAVVSSSVALILLVSAICCLIAYRRNKLKHASNEEDVSQFQTADSLQFDFIQIKTATHNFSEDNKLGQGGFGSVYKGRLDTGQEIAVKRLSKDSGQGVVEFKTEVLLVARLQHRNLVKLLGFCVSVKEKILVYEYLQNSSLDKFLFGTGSDEEQPAAAAAAWLDWETRLKIICGIAKGLLYLHEDSRLKIIHRDLKTSNILLDSDMNPKIADFGLARLLGVDETQDNTNKIAGTYGYMAPEYAITGRFSTKSDVYSFGVIVLEVVSGQKNRFFDQPQDEEPLIFRAWKLWEEGCPSQLVDTRLCNHYTSEDVIKCIHIGLLCIQESAFRRPAMASVVSSLNGQTTTLPSPTPPNFFTGSTTSEGDTRTTQMQKGSEYSLVAESMTEQYYS